MIVTFTSHRLSSARGLVLRNTGSDPFPFQRSNAFEPDVSFQIGLAIAGHRRRRRLFSAEDFLDRLLSRTKVRAKAGHGRIAYEETGEGIARQIVREELATAKCSTAELSRRRKGTSSRCALHAGCAARRP